jgi:outer membrane protein OmpA-like peptidoglycan-associated protein
MHTRYLSVLLFPACAVIAIAGCAAHPPVVVERTRVVHVETTAPAADRLQAPMRRDMAALADWQAQLAGMESRIDERGLVVRLGDAAFEAGRPDPTAATRQQLDRMAQVLANHAAGIDIVAFGDASGGMLARGQAVRDYLEDRGLEVVHVDPDAVRADENHLDIVISGR